MMDVINSYAEGDYSARMENQEDGYINIFHDLVNSVNRLGEELGNTEMLRSDFINDFSHEFKTPIVSIRGFAKLLKSESLSKEDRQEYIDIILEESTRLSSLSTNVLNLNKIEKQSIRTKMSAFNFAEMVRRVILMLETKWSKKHLKLDIKMEEVMYEGDSDLLSQMCINLIDNAIKFSYEGSEIEISLSRADMPNSRATLRFEVLDHGIGMTKDEMERIYDKFYQADSSRSTEGNGLGLSVTRRIVELYGGSIEAKSRIGEGCLFVVLI